MFNSKIKKFIAILVWFSVVMPMVVWGLMVNQLSHFYEEPFDTQLYWRGALMYIPGAPINAGLDENNVEIDLPKDSKRYKERMQMREDIRLNKKQSVEEAVEAWKGMFEFLRLNQEQIIIPVILTGIFLVFVLAGVRNPHKQTIKESVLKDFEAIKNKEVIEKAAGGERYVIEQKGKPKAAVVSMEDLKKLEEIENEIKIRPREADTVKKETLNIKEADKKEGE